VASARRLLFLRAAVVIGAAAAAALFLSLAWLAQSNTLQRNGRWGSAKADLDRGVVGAVSYMITRPALAGDRLHLDAWHGFQEVYVRAPLVPREVRFAMRLEEGAYLAVVYRRVPNGAAGVLLSRDPVFPSQAYAATADGEFTHTRPLSSAMLGPGWHRVSLTLAGGRVALVVDGVTWVSGFEWDGEPEGLAFRGGLLPAEVDDVEVVDGGEGFRDDFSNRRGLAGYVVAIFATLSAAGLALLRRGAPADVACLALAIAAGAAWAVDRRYLSVRYPTAPPDFTGFKSNMESEDQILDRLAARYGQRKPHPRRVLLIGTSQTWGAGASHTQDTFADRLQAALDASAQPVEIVNAGISGETAAPLARLLRERWIEFSPDLVVVNLGSNDMEEHVFEAALEDVAALDQARGAATLFVMEANTAERDNEALVRRHGVMRRVSDAHGVPAVDMHHALAAERARGFLWWDFVHPTSFGHRLIAERLIDPVRELLAAGPSPRAPRADAEIPPQTPSLAARGP
jgi:acyl-CoA thioesterase-1